MTSPKRTVPNVFVLAVASNFIYNSRFQPAMETLCGELRTDPDLLEEFVAFGRGVLLRSSTARFREPQFWMRSLDAPVSIRLARELLDSPELMELIGNDDPDEMSPIATGGHRVLFRDHLSADELLTVPFTKGFVRKAKLFFGRSVSGSDTELGAFKLAVMVGTYWTLASYAWSTSILENTQVSSLKDAPGAFVGEANRAVAVHESVHEGSPVVALNFFNIPNEPAPGWAHEVPPDVRKSVVGFDATRVFLDGTTVSIADGEAMMAVVTGSGMDATESIAPVQLDVDLLVGVKEEPSFLAQNTGVAEGQKSLVEIRETVVEGQSLLVVDLARLMNNVSVIVAQTLANKYGEAIVDGDHETLFFDATLISVAELSQCAAEALLAD